MHSLKVLHFHFTIHPNDHILYSSTCISDPWNLLVSLRRDSCFQKEIVFVWCICMSLPIYRSRCECLVSILLIKVLPYLVSKGFISPQRHSGRYQKFHGFTPSFSKAIFRLSFRCVKLNHLPLRNSETIFLIECNLILKISEIPQKFWVDAWNLVFISFYWRSNSCCYW